MRLRHNAKELVMRFVNLVAKGDRHRRLNALSPSKLGGCDGASPPLRLAARVAPCVLAVTLAWSAAGAAAQALSNPFFAFDNGTGRDQNVPFEAQAKMLKELGYAGIGFTGTQRIPEMLAALDANGLKMFNTYVGACVNPGRPPYDPGLKTAIHQLKGRDTVIWLYVTGGKPSSSAADDRAVAIVREIADMAAESGLRVALYPHTGLYVARVEDAVRLVKKVDRKNVGATFNLCHFLKTDSEKNLETRLKEVMPYLFVVSINGADGGADQRHALGPLDPNPRSRLFRRWSGTEDAQAVALHRPDRIAVLRRPRRRPRELATFDRRLAQAVQRRRRACLRL